MYENNVNSNCPEFGYELLSAVPYAYNLFLKGKLESTISAYDTSCLYFFSPNHTESNCQRSWNNMKKLWNNNFPNIQIHRKDLDWNLFSPPPFKEHYKSSAIKFEKETIVIFNRYNYEWGKPPINFLDLKTLEKLFDMLQDKYQIVYINIKGHKKYYDGVEPLDLKDDQLLLKYPKVIGINDIIKQYPDLTYNEVQLKVFANCEKYISSNGGQLILSAYFGGENIIFSKKCRELDPEVNSFYRWYHRLGGGVFQHVNNYDDLVELVRQKWVDNKPLFNILIRTSSRPNYFQGCLESIYKQKYKNWNIIIGVDNPKSEKYTKSAKGRTIHYNYKPTKEMVKPNSKDYGNFFIYNLYLNDLQDQVKNGYIIYLDDDDALYDENSLSQLSEVINSENQLVMWRVQFPNRLVPSNKNFGKKPVVRDISGIGFTFHNKYRINWEPFKRGDYRVAKQLYEKVPKITFLDKIITKLQRDIEDGLGRKDDITKPNTFIIEQTQEIENLLTEENTIELPKKKTLDLTKKSIDYGKINQIFNQKTNYIVTNNTQNNKPQLDLKKNTDLIQKMLPKNKRKFL